MTTWGKVRSALVADAYSNRTEFVMVIWSLILLLPTAIGLVMMLLGTRAEWLNLSMAVLVVLWAPPSFYYRMKDLASKQRVKPRAYPPVSLSDHSDKDGRLKISSWRWRDLGLSGLLVVGIAGPATMFTLTAGYVGSPAWWIAMGLWVVVGLLVVVTCLNFWVAAVSLMRLQARLAVERPDATFAVFKSNQVCSRIAFADGTSDVALWNIYTQYAVVAMTSDGFTVWDQSRGRPVKVATIARERVSEIRPSIAPVPLRFVRAIELVLSAGPEDAEASVLFAPIYYRRGFMQPLPDEAFNELQARVGEYVGINRLR